MSIVGWYLKNVKMIMETIRISLHGTVMKTLSEHLIMNNKMVGKTISKEKALDGLGDPKEWDKEEKELLEQFNKIDVGSLVNILKDEEQKDSR